VASAKKRRLFRSSGDEREVDEAAVYAALAGESSDSMG
jgi:hypothetical protein